MVSFLTWLTCSTLPRALRTRAIPRLAPRLSLGLAIALALVSGPGSQAIAQRLDKRVAASSPAPFRGEHCLGESKQKLLLEHYLAGSINPLGIGNSLRLSLCVPFITKPGILFDLTNFEVGSVLLTSPTDVTGGAFINFVPLSFLVLRAEASAFSIWPIPLQGAGFITLHNPSEFTIQSLSPSPFGNDPAGTATGGRFLLGMTLRGEVPIGRWLSIAVADSFAGEYWRLTESTWAPAERQGKVLFYAARRDVLLEGPGDWVLANTAALLLGIKAHKNFTVRVGATDDLVYVPSQAYVGNIAAGLLLLSLKNLRNLAKDASFFLRVGTFTNHAFRHGITFALGFDITYELLTRPHRRPPLPDSTIEPDTAPAAAPVAPADPNAEPAPARAS